MKLIKSNQEQKAIGILFSIPDFIYFYINIFHALFPYFFLSVAALFGQKITETVPLPTALNETSGLATFNGHLLTQNDSGVNRAYMSLIPKVFF